MSRGKDQLLVSIQDEIALERKRSERDRFSTAYFDGWIGSWVEKPDEGDVRSLRDLWQHFEKHNDARNTENDGLVNKLAKDCGLDFGNPDDHKLLIVALARALYPKLPGAKQKWGDQRHDDLWRDILEVEAERNRSPEGTAEKRLSNVKAAEALLNSKKLARKYLTKKRENSEVMSVKSLKDRIADAYNPDINPNLMIFDENYVVRGISKDGPACAAGLLFQKPLPRGSAAAEQALSLEETIFTNAAKLFEVLAIFLTDRSKRQFRIAARRIARRSVWLELSKNPTN